MGETNQKELFYKGKEFLLAMDFESAEKSFSRSLKQGNNQKTEGYLLFSYLLQSNYKAIAHRVAKKNDVAGFSLYVLYWFKFMTGELEELSPLLFQMLEDDNYFLRAFALKELYQMDKITDLPDTIHKKIRFFGLSYELPLEEQRASNIMDFLQKRYQLSLLQSKNLIKNYPKIGDVYLDFLEIVFKTCTVSSIKEALNNETIIKASELDFRVKYILSKQWYQLGEMDKSQEYLSDLLSYFKHNPLFQYNMGNIYCSKGKLMKAIDAYEEAISLAPLFERAYYNLGCAYFKLGEVQKATMNFGHAAKMSRKSDALYNLSVCLIEQRELQDAYFYLSKIPKESQTKHPPHFIQQQIRELAAYT
jgi:tetratricopeptide (TPR) repeat protein